MDNTVKKIAIFDDDEDIISICTFVLESKGWQVYAFTDCSDIVDKVSRVGPDVILMDNWIPDEGGIVATQQIKKTDALKHIPVIYFSANSNISTLTGEAGADTFLEKPFDLEELQHTISRVLKND
jgi:DNA-binding NtrC family response regulator